MQRAHKQPRQCLVRREGPQRGIEHSKSLQKRPLFLAALCAHYYWQGNYPIAVPNGHQSSAVTCHIIVLLSRPLVIPLFPFRSHSLLALSLAQNSTLIPEAIMHTCRKRFRRERGWTGEEREAQRERERERRREREEDRRERGRWRGRERTVNHLDRHTKSTHTHIHIHTHTHKIVLLAMTKLKFTSEN